MKDKNYNPIDDLKQKKSKKQKVELYAEKPASVVISIVLIILGSVFGIGSLGFAILSLVLGLNAGDTLQAIMIVVIMAFPIYLCGFMLREGIQTLGRLKRFQIYKDTLGTTEFCKIEVLAEVVQKSKKFVTKELEFMIEKEWFTQGHLDKQKTSLIVSDQTYQKYEVLESKHR